MSREAMKQALDALIAAEVLLPLRYKSKWVGIKAIAALEAELAKPEQNKPLRLSPMYEYGHIHEVPQPEQAPVAWMEMVVANLVRLGVVKHKAKELAYHFYTYGSQPRKEWVGLTEEERNRFINYANENFAAGVLWAEAKLKEKNGAL
jgi:hypothetical protein